MIRFLSSIILGTAATAAIVYLPTSVFKWVIFGITLIGLCEFGNLMVIEKRDRLLTVILGGILFLTLSYQRFLVPVLILILFFVLLWGMFFFHKAPRETAGRCALIFIGVCTLGLTMPFWGILHGLGFELIFIAVAPVVCCDTFGFLVGKRFGKRKLAPFLSPKKTWEGFFASLIGSILGFWGMVFIFFKTVQLSFWTGTFIAIGICLFAVLGDLSISFFKRTAGVKDSGKLIPGHGGMLDRLDALIFTAPFSYFSFLLISKAAL